MCIGRYVGAFRLWHDPGHGVAIVLVDQVDQCLVAKASLRRGAFGIDSLNIPRALVPQESGVNAVFIGALMAQVLKGLGIKIAAIVSYLAAAALVTRVPRIRSRTIGAKDPEEGEFSCVDGVAGLDVAILAAATTNAVFRQVDLFTALDESLET